MPTPRLLVPVSRQGGRLPAVVFAFVAVAMGAPTSRAATIAVNTTTDETDNASPNTDCSLREALQAASTDAAFGGCTRVGAAGADTIELPAGTYTISLAGATEDLNATGDFDVTSVVTIDGPAGALATIDGADLDRVFHVTATGKLTLNRLVVQNGLGQDGAGVFVASGAEFTAADTTFTSNDARVPAGLPCSGDGSPPPARGGAIFAEDTIVLTRCTLNGNTATLGSAIHLDAGSPDNASVSHVTLSDNVASPRIECSVPTPQGAFFSERFDVTMNNVTSAGNTATIGTEPGLFAATSGNSKFTYRNSILTEGCAGAGVFTTSGFNILNGTGCTSNTSTGGDSLAAANLATLATASGALTATRAPNAGSPASNNGSCTDTGAATITLDQTNFARPATGCDKGAFEGRCVSDALCNDSVFCTTDSCVPATGCSNTNNTLSCDDSNTCTLGDLCSGGTCAGSAKCNGNGTCSAGSCTCSAGKFGSRCEHTLSASPATSAVAGELWTISSTVTNATAIESTGVKLKLTVPANGTFQAVANCSAAAGVVTCDLGTIVGSGSASKSVDFLIAATATAGVAQSTTISTESFSETSGGVSVVKTTDVTRSSDLRLTGSTVSTAPIAGSTMTFTVLVNNDGPSEAANTTVSIPVPTGTTYSASSITCLGTTTKTCNVGTLVDGGSTSFTITFAVPSSAAAAASLTSAMTVISDSAPAGILTDESLTLTGTVTRQADLSVATSTAPATVIAGNVLALNIVATNAGPSDTTGVTVTFLPPTGTTLQTSTDCAFSTPNVICTAATITSGNSSTFNVNFLVPASAAVGATLSTTATVATTGATETGGVNTKALSSTVTRSSDLSVTTSSAPATVIAGDVWTVSATVENAGPSDAANVVIDVEPPSSAVFKSVGSDAGCTDLDTKVRCSVSSLSSGATKSFVVLFTTSSSLAVGSTQASTVSLNASGSSDPDIDDQSKTVAATVTRTSDLSVASSTRAASVAAGSNWLLTLVLTNNGLSDASNVFIDATIPASPALTFSAGASDAACTFISASSKVRCTRAALAAQASATFVVALAVPSSAAVATNSLSSSVTRGSTDALTDGTAGNDTATLVGSVTRSSDFSVLGSSAPATVSAGGTLVLTVVVLNNGPSDAAAGSVAVSVPVPAGTTFLTSTNCVAGTCTAPAAILSGGSVSFTVNFSVPGSVAAAASLSSAVSISNGTDSVPANNSITLATTVARVSDLSVVTSTAPSTVNAGEDWTVSAIIVNGGPSDAASILVDVTKPASAVFKSVGSSGTCSDLANKIQCSTSVTVAEGSKTVLVVFTTASSLAAAASQSATVSIASSGSSDPDSIDTSHTVTATVTRASDLSVAGSSVPSTIGAGQDLTVSAVVQNLGKSDAASLVIDVTTPPNATYKDALSDALCDANAGNVRCLLTSLAAGQSRTIPVVFTTLATLAQGATQTTTVSVSSASTDTVNTTNNSAALSSTVQRFDLAVTSVTASPATATPGNPLVFLIAYKNNGIQTIDGVTLTQDVPANTTFDVAGSSPSVWSCADQSTTGTCTLTVGTLAGSATGTARFAVKVVSPVPAAVTQISGTAAISTTNPIGVDSDTANNTVNRTVTITTTVTVTGSLADSLPIDADADGKADPGDTVRYVATIANSGSQAATAITLAATTASGATLVSGSILVNGSAVGGTLASVPVGTLSGGGATATVQWEVTIVSPAAALLTSIATQGTLTGSNFTTSATNDPKTVAAGDATVTVIDAAPDLVVTKTTTASALEPGNTIIYTVTVQNTGSQNATGVVLTETVPVGSTYLSSASLPDVWNCANGDAAGTGCTKTVGSLTAGASATSVKFGVKVDSKLTSANTTIPNTATAADDATNGTDLVPGNNAATASPTVAPAGDVFVSIANSATDVAQGQTVTYTLTYGNKGTATVAGQKVQVTIPAKSTFQTDQSSPLWDCPSAGVGGSTCSFTSTSVTAGTTKTAALVVKVDDILTAADVSLTLAATTSITSGSTKQLDLTNDSATDIVPIRTAPDLSVTLAANTTEVVAGQTVVYTVTYKNTGTRTSTGVTLTTNVPANTSYLASGDTAAWTCASGGAAGALCTLSLGTVPTVAFDAVNGQGTRTFTVKIPSSVPETFSGISDTVTISDAPVNPSELDTTNNSATVATAAKAAPDLALTAVPSASIVTVGTLQVYTLSYQNKGAAIAKGAEISVVVPNNSASNAGAVFPTVWSCSDGSPATTTCTLDLGDLAPGETGTADFAITIDATLPRTVSFVVMNADLQDDPTDPAHVPEIVASNNAVVISSPVEKLPDLKLTLAGVIQGGGSIAPGSVIVYTLSYSNVGNQTAFAPVLSETIPNNTSFTAAGSDAFNCPSGITAGKTCTLTLPNLAPFASGSKVFKVTVDTALPASATEITDSASVNASANDLDFTNNAATFTIAIGSAPDPAVQTLTNNKGTGVKPADIVIYTVGYANLGSSTATSTNLVLTVPDETTYSASGSASGWTCTPSNAAGSVCKKPVGPLTAGASASTTIALLVDTEVASSATSITASVSIELVGGGELSAANNSQSSTVTINGLPDLTINSIADGGITAGLNDAISYSIEYENIGRANASNVSLKETVPVGTTYVAGLNTQPWACTPISGVAGAVCTLTIGAAAVNTPGSVPFVVKVNSTLTKNETTIQNTAQIILGGTGVELSTANNSSTVVTPVQPGPELVVTKVADATVVTTNQTVTYTLTIENRGTSDATNVVLNERVPVNTQFVPGVDKFVANQAPVVWGCATNVGGTPCPLTIGTLAKNSAPVQLTYTVKVNASLTQVAKISNTVGIIDDDAREELDATNDSFTADVQVGGAPDLSLIATPVPATVTAGTSVLLDLDYKNAGSEPAPSSTIVVTLPSNVSHDGTKGDPTWSCVPKTGTTECTLALGTIPKSTPPTKRQLGLKVASALTALDTLLDIQATIIIGSTTITDLNPPDNTTSTTLTVSPGPLLTLSKTTPTVQAKVNENIVYTLSWQNLGRSDATNVVLTETVPETTTFFAAGSPGWVCAGVVAGSKCEFEIDDLSSKMSKEAEDNDPATPPLPAYNGSTVFEVTVDAVIPSSVLEITNTATLTDDKTHGVDLALGTAGVAVVNTLARGPDLVLSLAADKNPAPVGATVIFTLAVINQGTANATDTKLTVTVPPYSTYKPSQTPGWTCQNGGIAGDTCTLVLTGTLGQPGNTSGLPITGSASFAITVAGTLPAGTLKTKLNASAFAGGNVADLQANDNSKSLDLALNAAPDLRTTLASGFASALPGADVALTVKVLNAGTRGASGVTTTMVVPAGTRFNATASDLTWNCPSINAGTSCTRALGTIETSQSVDSAFVVTVDSPIAATIESTEAQATATDDAANGTDSVPADNTSTKVTILIEAGPKMEIAHVAPAVASPGNQFAYDLKYWNSGNQNARGVVLSATVPANTNFDPTASAAGWSCEPPAGPPGSRCTLTIAGDVVGNRNLASAAVVAFVALVDAKIPAGVDETSSTATVHDNILPLQDDDSETTTTPIAAAPDLLVTQFVLGQTYVPDENVAFSLSVKNQGSQTANGVVVTAVVPPNTSFSTNSTEGWVCDPPSGAAGSTCRLTVGTVAAVTPFPATFVVKVDNPVAAGVSNTTSTVTVADDGANGPDLKASDNTQSRTVSIAAEPAFALTKKANELSRQPGELITYSLEYENTGNQHATGGVLTETVPKNGRFVAAGSTAGWSCADGAATGSVCTLQDATVNVGQKKTALFVIKVDEPLAAKEKDVANSASFKDDGHNFDDNIAREVVSNTVKTPVEAVAGLQLSFATPQVSVPPGGRIRYALRYGNTGRQDGASIKLLASLPAFVRFDAGATNNSGWSCSDAALGPQTCTKELGALPVGAADEHALDLAVEVDAAFPTSPVGIPNTVLLNAQLIETAGDAVTAPAVASLATPVARCSTEFNFETAGGVVQSDALWAYVQNGALGGGYWKTAGDGIIKESDPDLVHMNFNVAVPTTSIGGLAPQVEVVFHLNGETSPTKDFIGICLLEPKAEGLPDYSCNINNAAYKTGQDTKPNQQPGGDGVNDFNDGTFDHVFLDAKDFVGRTVTVSIVYQTNGSDDAYPGLAVLSVRQFSDSDGDNQFDGRDLVCDICWDTDSDGFFNAESPAYVAFTVPRSCDKDEQNVEKNDCDDTDGNLDRDCTEDCADSIDNNNDDDVDCGDPLCSADPSCSLCEKTFTFDLARNQNGWAIQGSPIFALQRPAPGVPSGFVTTTVTKNERYTASISREVQIPAGMPKPKIAIKYRMNRKAKDGSVVPPGVFGVCFDQPSASACQLNPAKTANDNTDTETRTLVVDMPEGKIGNPDGLIVGVFYDTIGAVDTIASILIDEIAIRSDIDLDGRYESGDVSCDHCIDRDGDFYGDAKESFNVPASCKDNLGNATTTPDCDDVDVLVNPGVAVSRECAFAGDQNCDSVTDLQDSRCSVCGDGFVTAGEQCDDGQVDCLPWAPVLQGLPANTCPAADGDGCSKTCQLEPAFAPLYVSEIHLTRFGQAAGQYFELYNNSNAAIDPVLLGLSFSNKVGQKHVFAGCLLKTKLIPAKSYYVVSLGSLGQTGEFIRADAYCSGAVVLAEAAESLVLKDGADNIVDAVDLGLLACENNNALAGTTVERSHELLNPAGRSATQNDGAPAWCLSREKLKRPDGTTSDALFGSLGSAGNCGELFCDGVDDDCDDEGPDEIDPNLVDADADKFCDNPLEGSGAGDCDSSTPLCNVDCVTNIDKTTAFPDVPDCRDRCIDKDHDGYGAPGNLTDLKTDQADNLPCIGVFNPRAVCELCTNDPTLAECSVCIGSAASVDPRCSTDCATVPDVQQTGVMNCEYPRSECEQCQVGAGGIDCECQKAENQNLDRCKYATPAGSCNQVAVQKCEDQVCEDIRAQCTYCKSDEGGESSFCAACKEGPKTGRCAEDCSTVPASPCTSLSCTNPRAQCNACQANNTTDCVLACEANKQSPKCVKTPEGVTQNCQLLPTRECPTLDCSDADGRVNAGDQEGGAIAVKGSCTDLLDNDCDGRTDCSDEGCSKSADCNGATCVSPIEAGCGYNALTEVISDDYECGGKKEENRPDAVLRFVANAPQFKNGGTVTLNIDNKGRPSTYTALVFAEACPDVQCTENPYQGFKPAFCGDSATRDFVVEFGKTYYIIVDEEKGSCTASTDTKARVTIVCQEDCSAAGDEDADGKENCLDDECIQEKICAESDFDVDGISNGEETKCKTDPKDKLKKPSVEDLKDADSDGTRNCVDDDDDADGLNDILEVTTSPVDWDTDGDNLSDGEEVKNTKTNPVSPDTDGDGLYDGVEVTSCFNVEVAEGIGCQPSNPLDKDSDKDEVHDGDEDANGNGKVDAGETSPLVDDTDGDGAKDGLEVKCDSDPLDGLSRPTYIYWEFEGSKGDAQCDGGRVDSDKDGVVDGVENLCKTNSKDSDVFPSPTQLQDTDRDGSIDCVDLDDDDDTIPDVVEIRCGYDPKSELPPFGKSELDVITDVVDSDGDGLRNCEDQDDDDDGLSDKQEIELGTEKFDADSDDDGIHDGLESVLGLDPARVDTDGDGIYDGTEYGRTESILLSLTFGADTDRSIFRADGCPGSTTNPVSADTDGDSQSDGKEDKNANGCIDGCEDLTGRIPAALCTEFDPNKPTDVLFDADGDGLPDELEKDLGYDPKDADSDDDGLEDGLEVNVHHTNPLVPDTDEGGIGDGDEIANGTEPLDVDDDFSIGKLSGAGDPACTTQGGNGENGWWTFGLLAAMGALLFRRRSGAFWLGLVLLGVGLGAQDARAQVSDANLLTFMPGGGAYRVFSLETSLVSPHMQPYGAIHFSIERESLRLVAGDTAETLVAFQSVGYATAGVGLYEWAQVELVMPVGLALTRDENVKAVQAETGAGLGDLMLRVRGKALDNTAGGFGFGGSLAITIPTGDGKQFRGDPGFDVIVNLATDYRASRITTALNVGGRFRTETVQFFDSRIEHDLTFGLGFDYDVWPNHVAIGVEFFGKTPFLSPFSDAASLSVECLGGAKVNLWRGLDLEIAVGAGVVRAEGSPLVRVVTGLAWSPRISDSDGDMVHDVADNCPLSIEDKDGFQDGDGCPEPDNDGDGIPDLAEPEECRLLPEDRNGQQDDDGCPDEDHDGDRRIDIVDRCPRDAEDHDGFQDEDGCPEFDNDSDSVLDVYDECPVKAETYNGFKDEDGCPDLTPPIASVPCSPKCQYAVETIIRFGQGSSELTEEARSTLRRLAEELLSNEYVNKVELLGYASDEGDESQMKTLSAARATAVADYLAQKKVPTVMLHAEGFGKVTKKGTGYTNESAQMRWVEFKLSFDEHCRAGRDGDPCSAAPR